MTNMTLTEREMHVGLTTVEDDGQMLIGIPWSVVRP